MDAKHTRYVHTHTIDLYIIQIYTGSLLVKHLKESRARESSHTKNQCAKAIKIASKLADKIRELFRNVFACDSFDLDMETTLFQLQLDLQINGLVHVQELVFCLHS